MKNLLQSKDFIENKLNNKPEIAIVLGSGLGNLAEEIVNPIFIDYSEIPNFPKSTVPGHRGRLVSGQINGFNVIAMQGRFHYYEGYNIQTVVYPIRVFKLLGIKSIIVTNAAGGINTEFSRGDLMLITDHINAMGVNPLLGGNYDDLGPRFPDMSEAYNKDFIEKVSKSAIDLNINLRKGVYYATSGPNYETPAEIRMMRTLGADAVGMSTVPEVIVANHMDLQVLGISCITNMAAGILSTPLSHQEVLETTQKVNNNFKTLIKAAIGQMA